MFMSLWTDVYKLVSIYLSIYIYLYLSIYVLSPGMAMKMDG